jgi:TRAP-type C4-dicarboxylate transport system permease small subunit
MREAVLEKLILRSNRILRVFALVASCTMTLTMALIILNVVLRRFFNAPIFGATEIVCYASLVTASFALGQNEWVDGNIRMTLLLEKLSVEKGYVLSFVINVITTVAFVLFTYLLAQKAIGNYQKNDISFDLHFPVWVPAMILSVGFGILAVTMAVKALAYLYSIRFGHAWDFRALAITQAGDDLLE